VHADDDNSVPVAMRLGSEPSALAWARHVGGDLAEEYET
jgi:hypothetical protein